MFEFRDRNEELKYKIAQLSSNPTEIKEEIEEFSKYIIENLLTSGQIDATFMGTVYTYDIKFFKETFQDFIEKHYPANGIILNSIRCLRTFSQAIIGYEAIHETISKRIKGGKCTEEESVAELYALSEALQEMQKMPTYAGVDDKDKKRVTDLKLLPISYENLPDEVLIINLGNGCLLNVDTVYALALGADTTSWKVSRINPNVEYCEISTGGLLLCAREKDGRTDFVCCERTNTQSSKWMIEPYDENDENKGFTIRPAGRDEYLCAEKFQNFRLRVQLESIVGVDRSDSDRFTWKFRPA